MGEAGSFVLTFFSFSLSNPLTPSRTPLMVFSVLISSFPGSTTFSTVSVGFRFSLLNPVIPAGRQHNVIQPGCLSVCHLSWCFDESFLVWHHQPRGEHSSPAPLSASDSAPPGFLLSVSRQSWEGPWLAKTSCWVTTLLWNCLRKWDDSQALFSGNKFLIIIPGSNNYPVCVTTPPTLKLNSSSAWPLGSGEWPAEMAGVWLAWYAGSVCDQWEPMTCWSHHCNWGVCLSHVDYHNYPGLAESGWVLTTLIRSRLI